MKLQTGRQSLLATFLIALAFQCLSSAALAASSNYAMMMPKAAQALLLDVAVAGSRLVAVGERGIIVYSDDNGVNWTQAKVPSSAMLNRVFFATSDAGWAVGHDGDILVSRDGGVSWELQRKGMVEQARINEQRLGRAKVHLAELREKLAAVEGEEQKAELQVELEEAEFKVDDARAVVNEPVFPPPLMDVWFANDQEGWASGAYGTLLHTHNGGRSWQDWAHTVDNPDQLHLNGVVGGGRGWRGWAHKTDNPDQLQTDGADDAPGTLFLASEWGTVFRSTDGGQHWEALATGYEGSFFGVVVNPVSKSVFAYGLLGTIYRSTDNGDNWTEVESRARASLFGGDASADGRLVFVGAGGTATLSEDDGETFKPMLQPKRSGVYGVARLEDGRYVGCGDGGCRILESNAGAASKESQR